MDPLTSTTISGVFLLSGAVAVFTMMFRQGRPNIPEPKKYSTVHRISGLLFLFLYLFMFVSMVGRIGDFWEESSSRINMHVTLAVALFFLLLLKATIPRFFPALGRHLFALGSLVFLTSFSLVDITGGYYMIWSIDQMPYIRIALFFMSPPKTRPSAEAVRICNKPDRLSERGGPTPGTGLSGAGWQRISGFHLILLPAFMIRSRSFSPAVWLLPF